MASDRPIVVIHEDPALRYPTSPPFGPSTAYPEFGDWEHELSSSPNPVYEAIRGTFRRLGLDAERFDTPQWNPTHLR